MKKRLRKLDLFNPFTLVIFLTLICIILGVNSFEAPGEGVEKKIVRVINFWREGFFGLLGFTLQMMMILVFGYCLAIYQPVFLLLKRLADWPKSQVTAVAFVASVAMIAGLLNWGFGLIVGALLARFVTQSLQEKGLRVNAALIATAGGLGMAVWHGGFSGSAPLKVAESEHFLVKSIGVIAISETTLSSFNLLLTSGLVAVFLVTILVLAWKNQSVIMPKSSGKLKAIPSGTGYPTARLVGIAMLLALVAGLFQPKGSLASFFDLNLVNFLLFGLVLYAYRSLDRFTESVTEGIKSSVDIFIQFPFYAGILGVLEHSGALSSFSNWVVETSTSASLPVFSMISAALINFFVPSGGGQWAVQGPVVMSAASALNLPLGRMVMVFSYGDQITNLLQPFWLLPLLAITGVSARAILNYSFWLFLAGLTYLVAMVYLFF